MPARGGSKRLASLIGQARIRNRPMRIYIQPAIQVDAQERIQRLVPPAVFGFLNRVAQIDPDAVAHAVVVVVDVPAADDVPDRN